ncbi:MAG: P-II family nitrogen regulator [Candidatus Dormibacteraceae bacterium]
MKMVVAIIRHERLQEVQDVLDACGVSGMTVSEVQGCGEQRGYTERYRGTTVNISLLHRLKIESVVPDEIVDKVVTQLAEAARTGEVGDGKIFVLNVEQAIQIRTGENGPQTIQHQNPQKWGH